MQFFFCFRCERSRMMKLKVNALSFSFLCLSNIAVRLLHRLCFTRLDLFFVCVCAARAAWSFYRVRQRQGRFHNLQRPRQPDEDHGLHANWNGVDRTQPEHQHEPWVRSIQHHILSSMCFPSGLFTSLVIDCLWISFLEECAWLFLTFHQAAMGQSVLLQSAFKADWSVCRKCIPAPPIPGDDLALFAFLFFSSRKYQAKMKHASASCKQCSTSCNSHLWLLKQCDGLNSKNDAALVIW